MTTTPEEEFERWKNNNYVDERIDHYFRNFKYAGGVTGAIIIAAVWYFHKDIINGLVNYGSTELVRSIETKNKSYLDKSQDLFNKHLETLQKTQQDLQHSQTLFRATNDATLKEQDRFSNKVAEFRDQYATLAHHASNLNEKAQQVSKETESATKKVSELIRALDEAGEVTRTRIADAQQRAVNESDQRIAALEKRIAAMQTTLVRDLKNIGINTSIPVTPSSASTEPHRPTVYFQFAGFTRDEAERISRAISDNGQWNIPGEERTPKAVNTNEVRFNPSDRVFAEKLVQDANNALKKLGINIQLVGKENKAVRQGFAEIWIYKA